MEKQCTCCKEIKPYNAFSKDDRNKNGLQSQCRACINAANKKHVAGFDESQKNKQREYKKRHRESNYHKYKNSNLIREYGITLHDYNELLKIQNYSCAICKKHMSEFRTMLAVDHCHTTGKVRGLLCRNCNQGLGHFKDSTTYLESAKNYLDNDIWSNATNLFSNSVLNIQLEEEAQQLS